MMEQSMGVMSAIAIRKVICVRKKPKTEAAKIFGKSRLSTCSAGMKRERIQKRDPAPKERRQNRAMGEIKSLLVISLHITMFRPKIA